MFSSLKKTIKKLSPSTYEFVSNLYRKIMKIQRHPIQNYRVAEGYNIVHLGTEYGGWSYVDEDSLKGSTIISAGLGEDASFDVEFASKYHANIILVDPTPRAISHFKEIQSGLGCSSTQKYLDGGCQPISSYDLSKLNKNSLSLITKALWDKNTTVKFYEPPNSNHVSHSIVNYQNNFSEKTKYIEVEAITLDTLILNLNIKPSDIPLMKFDIEGAEIEVLTRSLSVGILPRQILVEFDELNVPSAKGFARVSKMDELLQNKGYKLLKTDGKANFLYFKADV